MREGVGRDREECLRGVTEECLEGVKRKNRREERKTEVRRVV